jgi:putative ABC transport system ATP-binding protein
MARTALEGRGLVKTYPLGDRLVVALNAVDLRVATGEFVAVMGPSGSGKSTLLHCLGLLDRPDAGEVSIEGRPAGTLDDDEQTRLRSRRLGFIFQSYELVATLTARENILLPAELAGETRGASARLADLARLLDLGARLDHRPGQLSGGERQRVAIARAFINRPAVALADEPTGNLDARNGAEVLDFLRRGVDEREWTVVMVTHDPRAAMRADRVVFLRDGQVASAVHGVDAETVRAAVKEFVGI